MSADVANRLYVIRCVVLTKDDVHNFQLVADWLVFFRFDVNYAICLAIMVEYFIHDKFIVL